MRDFLVACCASLYLSVPALAGAPVEARRSSPDRTADAVRIVLCAEATGENSVITVADVAKLEGGDPSLRQYIAQLDLVEIPFRKQALTVTREQVFFRIQMARIDQRQFRLEGADKVKVEPSARQTTAKDVELAARLAILQRVPWKPDDVNIRLLKPIDLPPELNESLQQVRWVADLAPAQSLAGRQRVDVAYYVEDQPLGRVHVLFDVCPYQDVAVATRRLERGEVLGPQCIHRDRRADDKGCYLSYSDSLVGKRVKRTIAAGQLLLSYDVEPVAADNPVLVKQQSIVKLVARVGKLQVTARGEALRNGKKDDVIPVRNVDSKKIVHGKVVDGKTVDVSD